MVYAYLTAAVLAIALVVAFRRSGDTFHPAVFCVPALAFLYSYLPIRLDAEDGFGGFLTPDQVTFANWMNLVGVVAFVLGMFWGESSRPAGTAPALTEPQRKRLLTVAVVFGGLGLLSWVIGIVSVGGFSEAYGKAYGGGWSDSGYARDLVILTLPGLILVPLLNPGRMSWRTWMLVALFALPMGVQGIFGARRGPTFMTAVGGGVSHYIARQRRPALLTVLLVGLGVGMLMLFLVSNRASIYWGSEEQIAADPTEVLKAGTGNEFIYGAGALVHYDLTGRYLRGGRYATILFIRPIPRAIWPTKYEWASEFFNIPNLEVNLGTAPDEFEQTLGWRGADGAAPGLIADMFIEFGYFFPIAVFLIAAAFGWLWRRATAYGGVYLPLYCLAVALSVYLITQSVEALLFRFIFAAVPLSFAWRWAVKPRVLEDPRPMATALPQGAPS